MSSRVLLVLALLAALLTPSAAPAAPAVAAPPEPRLVRADATSATVELRVAAPLLSPSGVLTMAGADEPPAGQLPSYSAALGVPAGAALALDSAQSRLQPLPAGAKLPAAPAVGCTPAASISGEAWMRGQRIVTLALNPIVRCANGTAGWQPRLSATLRWQGSDLAPSSAPADPLLDAALATALLNTDQARPWRVAPPAQPDELPTPAERYKISVNSAGLTAVTYDQLQAAGAPVASLDPRSFRLTNRGRPVAILVAGESDGRLDPGDRLSFVARPIERAPVRDSVILNGALVVADTVVSASYSAELDYTDRNVYWLEVGGSPGPRMATLAAPPDPAAPVPSSFRTTVRAEESNSWWTWHFTSRDTWFWGRIVTGTPIERYAITLPVPDPSGQPAQVYAEAVAFSHNPAVTPDHRSRLALNEQLVVDQAWDGPTRGVFTGSVPAASLIDGTNRLSFEALLQPGIGSDTLFFDFFTVSYSRLFRVDNDRLRFDYPAGSPSRFLVTGLSGPEIRVLDVADPDAPRLLDGVAISAAADGYAVSFSSPDGGGSFLVLGPNGALAPLAVERKTASGLRSAANSADYIIVAPAELRAGAERIAAYRAAQGMRVAVADLAAVIDEFNDGIYHPVAIKRFLAYAYATWQGPAPQYALLLGDGHWNTRNFAPSRYPNTGPQLMPPNMAWVDPFQGQVDSANQLAAFVGDDILPDIAIARLPARSLADVEAALAKTAAHEGAPADAPWRKRLLFVADNQPDPAGDFAATLDRVIADTVPQDKLAVDRLYLDQLCGPAQNPPQPCPSLTGSLVQTLNLTGTLMLTYSGHGAIQRWANEAVLSNSPGNNSVSGLQNGERPPFVVSLDCLDGYWAFPGTEGLIETLVRMPGGGAVAAFSPTGLGVATGHEQLQRGLNRALFRGGPQRIGPASMAAKVALFAASRSNDLVDTFTIFGDPALALALPETIAGPPPVALPTPPAERPTPSPTPRPREEQRLYMPLTRAGSR